MSIKVAIAVGVSLLVLFVIAGSLILPFFRNTYEHGFGSRETTDLSNEYCTSIGSLTACSGCNATSGSGYETFLDTCHSLVSRTNNTHCYACGSFGFRNTARGMAVLIFVVGMIYFIVRFLPKRTMG